MKKKSIIWVSLVAVAVLGVSGAMVAFAEGPDKDIAEGTSIQVKTKENGETEMMLSVQKATDEVTIDVATEPRTETEAESKVDNSSTVDSKTVSPAPAENHEPAFVKVSEDDSPEGKLAEQKAWLASEAEFSAMINAEKKSLEAQKTEILSAVKGDVALMSAAQTAEIARIDDRLEEIWMNHSTLTDDPDFYDYEKYFVRHMTDTVNQSSAWLEMGFFAPDSHEYYHNTGLVEICTAALEMYNEGAEVDEAYLYYYESLEKLINYQW